MSQSPGPRRLSFNAILLAAIAIPIALVTLLALSPLPGLPDVSPVSQTIVQIVTVGGAIAVIIGILNLLAVHFRKLAGMQSVSSLYSGITLLTMIIVLVLHVLELRGIVTVGTGGGTGNQPALTLRLMDVLQVAIESALSGLLFFFLVYSAYRMMRRRVSIWGVIFIITLLIVLLGYALPPGSILASLRDWVLRVPVAAGTRGLLIGIAIGTITVGVRVLIGQDRVFRE